MCARLRNSIKVSPDRYVPVFVNSIMPVQEDVVFAIKFATGGSGLRITFLIVAVPFVTLIPFIVLETYPGAEKVRLYVPVFTYL